MKWIIDDDGALGLTFWGIVTFIKYKNNVIVVWFKKYEYEAPKYIS